MLIKKKMKFIQVNKNVPLNSKMIKWHLVFIYHIQIFYILIGKDHDA